ncbi:MAG: MarR family transcriptional regulator [Pseudomonadota bacterium]
MRNSKPATDDDIQELIELFFFAYRDFTADPDAILAEIEFGRAHHRVIHFVGHRPGLTVAELLELLRITKQSLGRVLKQLVEEGFVNQVQDREDRRQKRLSLTEKGANLLEKLRTPQAVRIQSALLETGYAAEDAAHFLKAMTGSLTAADKKE